MKNLLLLAICIVLLLVACNSPKKIANPGSAVFAKNENGEPVFDTEAHRGGRGIMPENTIPAMLHALDLNVRTLEMDIVITNDKKVILSHEPFFNHEISTKPNGEPVAEKEEKSLNIFRMNYGEVVKFDVGLRPHPRFPQQQKIPAAKPLLSDVFDSVSVYMNTAKRPFPLFNIETKCKPGTDNIYHPSPHEMVDLLMQVVKDKGMENQVMIQSFDFRSLQYLRANYPSIPAVMLIEDFDKISFEDQLIKLGFIADVYSPHYSLVTKDLVDKCHAKNMRIVPWTVNDKTEIEKLKDLGVDGVISDFPDLF